MTATLENNDPRISIGIGTWASNTPILRPHHVGNKIIIGNYCALGQNVTVFAGGNHPMQNITQFHLKLYLGIGGFEDWSATCPGNEDITTIGNDVWLGDGSIVLSGLTIGHGAAIGARAVVTRNVPPYGVVAGNPARLTRKRFTENKIDILLNLAWWDWPREDLISSADLLFSGDVDLLAEFASTRLRGTNQS